MMDIVSSFNKQSEEAARPISNYLELVNKFLSDSGKQIIFDDAGTLAFKITGQSGLNPVTSLSSGEAQIFVILTHLCFNPAAHRTNVFIVDEPELSLHVQWQELFVESVQAANPNIQYIMATHAPSIILNRINHCRDMSRQLVREK